MSRVRAPPSGADQGGGGAAGGADGTSLKQFALFALAAEVAALRTADFFAERRTRAK